MSSHPLTALGLLIAIVATMTACGNGSVGPPPTPPNQAPTANAGPDQSVDEGILVNLPGIGADSDGTISAFSWQQDGGTAVTITDADLANASFTAPEIAASEDLVFRLTVTDNDGATGSDTVTITVNDTPPVAPVVNVDVGLKQLIFSWAEVPGATHYKLMANPDGHSGFTQVGSDIPGGILSVRENIAVHLFDFANALYMLEACNTTGCSSSTEVNAMNGMLDAIGYFKASNTELGDNFGEAVALSADGATLVVGARLESSSATGVGGDQDDNSAGGAGAAYIFRFDGTDWSQQAYIKASNAGRLDGFGGAVALSADGNTLAVGARFEDSYATGVGGDQNNDWAGDSGAVYVFRFDGTAWSQQAYIKASNTGDFDLFGWAVALSADGATLAVGARLESSNATGIDGDQNNNSALNSGAVYLFRFDGADWAQQAYIKASNTGASDQFGRGGVALSTSGDTLVVGAPSEGSNATGVGGDQDDNSAVGAGAVYLFRFDGTDWAQQAYIKASNTGPDGFGGAVALSAGGNTLAVGARFEDSNATGVGGDQIDNSTSSAGAVYLFWFDGTIWSQQAYIKASNTGDFDRFGGAVALSADGNTLAVGATSEGSSATGVDGDQDDNSAGDSGAVYVFRFDGTGWSQQTYIKASNTDPIDDFGGAVSLGADGATLVVGAYREDSNATGINGDQIDNSATESGALYLY